MTDVGFSHSVSSSLNSYRNNYLEFGGPHYAEMQAGIH